MNSPCPTPGANLATQSMLDHDLDLFDRLVAVDPHRRLKIEQALIRVAQHGTDLLTLGLSELETSRLLQLVQADLTTVQLHLFADAAEDAAEMRKRVVDLAMHVATRAAAGIVLA